MNTKSKRKFFNSSSFSSLTIHKTKATTTIFSGKKMKGVPKRFMRKEGMTCCSTYPKEASPNEVEEASSICP